MPFWSNSLIRLYSWIVVLGRGGFINYGLDWLGFPMGNGILYTYPAIIIGLVHAYLPYMVLTIYIALDRLDNHLIEASASLGSTPLTTFRRVIFPLSLPGVLSGVILVFIPAIGSFVEPRLLGGKAGTMLGTVIEDQFVQVFNWPLGAALSFIMLLIVASSSCCSRPGCWPRGRKHERRIGFGKSWAPHRPYLHRCRADLSLRAAGRHDVDGLQPLAVEPTALHL